MEEEFKKKLQELKSLSFQIEMLPPNGRNVHAKANLLSSVSMFMFLEKDENFVPDRVHFGIIKRSVEKMYKFLSENKK